MSKVILVEANWPSTGSKFVQAFEDKSKALAKYEELKSDNGAQVMWTLTKFEKIEDLVLWMNPALGGNKEVTGLH